MRYYKFFCCIKLPISIVLTSILAGYIYNFEEFVTNKVGLILWFGVLGIAVLYTILLYKMYYKSKDTYYYFVVCLIIDMVTILMLQPLLYFWIKDNTLTSFIVICTMILWFVINNVYIRNRENIFIKNKYK